MHAVYTGDVYDGRFSISADINGDIRRVVQIDCLICGEPFPSRLDNLKRGKGLTCSRSCAGTLGARNRNKKHGLTGESTSNWRGGVSANPYRYKKRQMDRYPGKSEGSGKKCTMRCSRVNWSANRVKTAVLLSLFRPIMRIMLVRLM